MFTFLKEKPSIDRIKEIILDAVAIEKTFLTEAMPCNMIGMNCDLMKTYIEYVADHLLVELTGERVFNVKNPFSFMERISFDNKTNFFERKVGEYAKADSTSTMIEREFKDDVDF